MTRNSISKPSSVSRVPGIRCGYRIFLLHYCLSDLDPGTARPETIQIRMERAVREQDYYRHSRRFDVWVSCRKGPGRAAIRVTEAAPRRRPALIHMYETYALLLLPRCRTLLRDLDPSSCTAASPHIEAGTKATYAACRRIVTGMLRQSRARSGDSVQLLRLFFMSGDL